MVYVVNTCGYGSFGDDSYGETLQKKLADTWPMSQIVVQRMENVPFSPDSQEAVVLGGGGILYRHTYDCGSDSLKHFLRYPAAAQVFGKRTYALSVGVQGALKSEDLKPYAEIFNAMTLRTVRDSRSAELLRDAGVTAPLVESADLSYLVKLPERTEREAGRKPVLGVVASQPDKGVIYEESQGFDDSVLGALHELHREFEIHFYSFDRRSDVAIPGRWAGPCSMSHYNSANPGAVDEFIAAIADSDLFLTTRLHGVIFCARMGIPFVSMGAPDEKVERESRALHHKFHLAYSAKSGDIVNAIRNAWADRAQIAPTLQSAAACRKGMARRTVEALHTCN